MDAPLLTKAINTLAETSGVMTFLGASAEQPLTVHGEDGTLPYVAPDEISKEDYDILLIIGGQAKEQETRKRLLALGVAEEKMLLDRIVVVPGFSWGKYKKLRASHLSIMACNCFGGITYHHLGLPFESPLINMFILEDEFLRVFRHPYIYFQEPLEYVTKVYEPAHGYDYPVWRMGDVNVSMNHYPDFDAALKIWEKRKKRINWYNLFVTMYTERPENAEKFDQLPFAKKVCFVPFHMDLDSAWQVNPKATGQERPLWDTVNQFGMGNPHFYDMFDMLLYGKKTPLMEIEN